MTSHFTEKFFPQLECFRANMRNACDLYNTSTVASLMVDCQAENQECYVKKVLPAKDLHICVEEADVLRR